MIDPRAVEWDEYFELCEPVSSTEKDDVAVLRVAKLRQCINGVRNSPISEPAQVRKYLLENQLSSLVSISRETNIGHDRLKEILFQHRDQFFVMRANALRNDSVVYSALEDRSVSKRKADREIYSRKLIVRWMNLRGFIDAFYFHQPLNMEVEELTNILDDMRYPSGVVNFGDRKRLVHFKSMSLLYEAIPPPTDSLRLS